MTTSTGIVSIPDAPAATIRAALDYAARGWPVVLNHTILPGGPCSCGKADCHSKGKHPIYADWPARATTDEDELLAQFDEHPQAHVGVLTGPQSGIVDVEWNRPEGEQIVNLLFGGEPPITPMFQATRGKHRLLRWRPGLPDKARYYIGDRAVEIIPGNQAAQVVMPPVDEPPRYWLPGLSPAEVDLAEISDEAFARLVNWRDMSADEILRGTTEKATKDWPAKLAGVAAGGRNGAACEVLGRMIHQSRYDLGKPEHRDELWQWFLGWNRGNTPPMSDDELQGVFRKITARAARASGGNGQDQPRNGQPRIGQPEIIRLDSVQPKRITWLWPGRVAMGKFTLLAGDPGLGKSLVTVDMASRITRGASWPDRPTEPIDQGDVVFLTAEDSAADTLRPRLDAATGDPTRVHLLRAVRWYDHQTQRETTDEFSLDRDLPTLRTVIEQTKCRLVVVDPVSAYLGDTNSHKNAEVRRVLGPLATLAEETGVAVVGVEHLNKAAQAGKAVYRVNGSIAFVAAARAVWAIVRDPADPSRRLMVAVKNNLAADDLGGLAYSIVAPDDVPCVAWGTGRVDVTADQALAPAPPPQDDGEREEAVGWLRARLEDGPVESRDLQRAAKQDGLAWRTIRRAAEELKVTPRRTGFGKGGTWTWELPGEQVPF